MLEDPDDLAIVKGVVGLAQAFHRRVLAEGVRPSHTVPCCCRWVANWRRATALRVPCPRTMPRWMDTWRPDAA